MGNRGGLIEGVLDYTIVTVFANYRAEISLRSNCHRSIQIAFSNVREMMWWLECIACKCLNMMWIAMILHLLKIGFGLCYKIFLYVGCNDEHIFIAKCLDRKGSKTTEWIIECLMRFELCKIEEHLRELGWKHPYIHIPTFAHISITIPIDILKGDCLRNNTLIISSFNNMPFECFCSDTLFFCKCWRYWRVIFIDDSYTFSFFDELFFKIHRDVL